MFSKEYRDRVNEIADDTSLTRGRQLHLQIFAGLDEVLVDVFQPTPVGVGRRARWAGHAPLRAGHRPSDPSKRRYLTTEQTTTAPR